ncbi:MAG: GGDEF domain-containing protein [Saccharofermentans sp.]|nr:GGDEF domain-containing protein [Saccharofermentans sp.]
MGKLTDIIFKDASGANESNRVSYIVRINSLMMCCYFIIWIAVFGISGKFVSSGMCLLGLAAYAFSTRLTYKGYNTAALGIYSFVTILWMLLFVIQWGWDCGIQHFVFVLLVLAFVGTYRSFKEKLLLSAGVFLIRMLLYIYHIGHEPVEVLSKPISITFQIINIASVFFSLIVILSIFTRDKLATEAKLAQYNRQLKKVAEHDHLTGLLNRRSGMEETIGRIMRGGFTTGLCVAIGDIDHFKHVNDTYGHEAGDEVLKSLAKLFEEYMSNYGIAVRWGGEEFVFVFDDINLDDAFVALDSLRHKISGLEIYWKDIKIPVTMTFGVTDVNVNTASTDDIEKHIEQAIDEADKKLYIGKESGRNKVVI